MLLSTAYSDSLGVHRREAIDESKMRQWLYLEGGSPGLSNPCSYCDELATSDMTREVLEVALGVPLGL